MQILNFVPDAMLLMSLAGLMPPYQKFMAEPRPRVSVVTALREGGAPMSRVMRAQKAEIQRYGANLRPAFPRSRCEANRRSARLNRQAKLLWSDVLEMRKNDPGGGDRVAYVTQVQQQLKGYGVEVSRVTIRQILNGESWQELR